MSRNLSMILIKWSMIFIAGWFIFGYMDGNTIGLVFFVSLIATVANYLLGDLFVLPRLGNIIASILDGLMGGLIGYLFALIVPNFLVSWATLSIFALLISIMEYFFHIYLANAENLIS